MSHLVTFAQEGLGMPSAAEAGAAADAAANGAASSPNPMSSFMFFGVLMLVFYFMIFRPQHKRQKAHTSLVSELKRGDHIITNGGIYGRIHEAQDSTLIVEVAKNVHLKMLKNQIACLQTPEAEGGTGKDSEALRNAAA